MKPALVFDWHGTLWTPLNTVTPSNPIGVHPDLIPILNRLHQSGVSLAVLSNTDSVGTDQWFRKKLNEVNILHLFSVIISSADVGTYKPDLDIFLLTARFLHRQPHRIIMVGDSETTDGAASRVGWQFKHVPFAKPSEWIHKIEGWCE